MKGGFQIGSILALSLLAAGCSGTTRRLQVAEDVRRNADQYDSVVAFDLRDDSNPGCSLLLHQTATPGTGAAEHMVLLPFPTTGVENSREVFTSWSSIDWCCSLVSYIHLPDKSGSYVIPLSPTFSAQPQDLSDLPGQIYFLRLGQERRFIYRYDLPAGSDDVKRLLSEHFLSPPDAIAIARPANAKGLEIKDGKTEIPARKSWNGVAGYYAATAAEAGSDHLELRYELPLSSAQQLALKFLSEVLGVLGPPIVVLLFLDFKDRNQGRSKIVVLCSLAFLEAAILSTVAYLAWQDRTAESTEAALSSIVVLIGLVVSGIVAYMKKRAGNSPSVEVDS